MVEQEPFKLLVVGSSPSTLTPIRDRPASWLSGKAVDCKSIIREFESHPALDIKKGIKWKI